MRALTRGRSRAPRRGQNTQYSRRWDATGAGSWAAATPKRVIEMTADIIGGGACNYSLVVVKIPQIRAQILGLCESAKVKARLSIYRSCRDAPHVV